MKAAAGAGYATATDLADWLVRALKIPFREAHHATGRIVALAATRGVALEKLTLDEMKSVEPRITEEAFGVLGVERSVGAARPTAEPRPPTCAARRRPGSSGWARGDVEARCSEAVASPIFARRAESGPTGVASGRSESPRQSRRSNPLVRGVNQLPSRAREFGPAVCSPGLAMGSPAFSAPALSFLTSRTLRRNPDQAGGDGL